MSFRLIIVTQSVSVLTTRTLNKVRISYVKLLSHPLPVASLILSSETANLHYTLSAYSFTGQKPVIKLKRKTKLFLNSQLKLITKKLEAESAKKKKKRLTSPFRKRTYQLITFNLSTCGCKGDQLSTFPRVTTLCSCFHVSADLRARGLEAWKRTSPKHSSFCKPPERRNISLRDLPKLLSIPGLQIFIRHKQEAALSTLR